MAATTNSNYGHNAILARYVGLEKPRPIFGYLLHGWHPWFPWEPDAADLVRTVPTGVPILAWKSEDERHLRAAGAKRVTTIGSPFLYLLRMEGEPALPADRSLVAFPFHTHATAEFEESWDEYASYLASLDYDRVTVCLYPEDHDRADVRAFFERRGFEVATNGRHSDPRFLYRLYDLVACHATVTSNRMTTALVYGTAMGRNAFLGGPVPGIAVHETAGPLENEGERAGRYQRERYPELVAGIDPDTAREFGWANLGADCLREPEELAEILGWSGPKRAAAVVLRAASSARRRVGGL